MASQKPGAHRADPAPARPGKAHPGRRSPSAPSGQQAKDERQPEGWAEIRLSGILKPSATSKAQGPAGGSLALEEPGIISVSPAADHFPGNGNPRSWVPRGPCAGRPVGGCVLVMEDTPLPSQSSSPPHAGASSPLSDPRGTRTAAPRRGTAIPANTDTQARKTHTFGSKATVADITS